MTAQSFSEIAQQVAALAAQQKTPFLVGIDGRCGSGKSSLTAAIAGKVPCAVFHMDDFYLPFSRRAQNWEQTPGGNIDFARLSKECITPALEGKTILYRAYSCPDDRIKPAVTIPPCGVYLVEGSYSMHPALAAPFAFTVFLSCSKEVQAQRLRRREGTHFAAFETRWIPMEERYFARYPVQQNATAALDTDKLFR